jgi:hypothetical protein
VSNNLSNNLANNVALHAASVARALQKLRAVAVLLEPKLLSELDRKRARQLVRDNLQSAVDNLTDALNGQLLSLQLAQKESAQVHHEYEQSLDAAIAELRGESQTSKPN